MTTVCVKFTHLKYCLRVVYLSVIISLSTSCAVWHPGISPDPLDDLRLSPREQAQRDHLGDKILTLNLVVKSCTDVKGALKCHYQRSLDYEQKIEDLIKKNWPVQKVVFIWPFSAEKLELDFWSETGEHSLLSFRPGDWLVDGVYQLVFEPLKRKTTWKSRLTNVLSLGLFPLTYDEHMLLRWTPLLGNSWPFRETRTWVWKEVAKEGYLLWLYRSDNLDESGIIEKFLLKP